MANCASTTGAALLLLFSQLTRAAAPDSTEVQLSSRDRAQVIAAACGAGRDAEQLRASRAGKGSAVEVAVRCTPHRNELSLPVARVTSCGSEKGLWHCAPGQDALMMKLGDSPALALVPGAVPAREALYLVTEADKLTVPPFQKPARGWLQGQCTVAQMRDATFRGGTIFDLKCTPGTLLVTRDCWKDRCRFFITGSTD